VLLLVPLALAEQLQAGTVDHQMQRPVWDNPGLAPSEATATARQRRVIRYAQVLPEQPERRGSYVDGPLLTRCLQCFDRIACVHMSGLLVRSHMSAGQDGFRDGGSRQNRDLVEGH
jgi:hypothetical protein